MNTVIGSLLILCILPIICAWIAAYFRQQQLGSIDNKEPRIQSQQLSGAGARAVAAQGNSWEALAIFSAAALALFIAGVDLQSVSTLAMVFVALRIAYIPAYIANVDILRSLIFIGGFGICLYFFYLALSAN
ncbi:MAG: MAPEG family protein [Halioglobus sp.]|nr:MAPEG family protein [Halioglobus sp.]